MELTNRSTLSRILYNLLANLFDLQNSELTLMETGGTITSDGTEQVLWLENAPLGNQDARTLFVDLDNMQAGDTVASRIYYRLRAGGGLQLQSYNSYSNADGGLTDSKKIVALPLYSNRFGIQISIQRSAGVDRAYDWAIFTEG